MSMEHAKTAALRADLDDFVHEISPIEGVIAVRMEHKAGVARGQELEEIFGGEAAWQALREDVLQWAQGEQDSFTCDWQMAQLGLYRVGVCVSLWVYCDSRGTEQKVRATWKSRRGPWQQRLDRRQSGPPEPPKPPMPQEQAWRARVSDKVSALLDETFTVYETLRCQDPGIDAPKARDEFDALVDEWTSYCDPSVISFPMLLDSLRQCMAPDGPGRAQFFDKIQSLMARFMM